VAGQQVPPDPVERIGLAAPVPRLACAVLLM
jgi:hypothetical protein